MNLDNLEELDVKLGEQYNEPYKLPTFAVGGAVRDAIRGVEPTDVDLMVAEVTPSEMKERGFKLIDNDNNETFAVFLDEEGREVAIAREERSTGDGHKDFEVEPVPSDVRATEAAHRDLKRRDLTINAMAYDARWGALCDPHDGWNDLREGVVRHVDGRSFIEDPLRILRAARFAARLDFEVNDDTLGLMEDTAELISELPQERVRMEIEKNFQQAETPRKFFDVLAEVGALRYALPPLAGAQVVPAGPEQYHGEGSVYEHTMRVLEEAHALLPNNEKILWMALAHDIGKTGTPMEEWPSHPNHGEKGVDVIENLKHRLKFSNEQTRWMKHACRYHGQVADIEELRESTVLNMWERLSGDETSLLPMLCVADAKGREPQGNFDPFKADARFLNASRAYMEWDGERLIDEGYSPEEMGGEEFGNLLHQKRVERMRELEG